MGNGFFQRVDVRPAEPEGKAVQEDGAPRQFPESSAIMPLTVSDAFCSAA